MYGSRLQIDLSSTFQLRVGVFYIVDDASVMFWLIRLGVVPRNKVLLTFSSAGPHQRRSAQVERNGSLDAAEGPGIPGRNHNADKARLSIGSVMVGRNAYRHAPAVARDGDWDSVSAGLPALIRSDRHAST